MHALGPAICVPSLVLIAQVVFLSDCRHAERQTHTQTHKVTDATDRPTLASATAGVGNKCVGNHTEGRKRTLVVYGLDRDCRSCTYGLQIEWQMEQTDGRTPDRCITLTHGPRK